MPHFLEPYFTNTKALFHHTDNGGGSAFQVGRRRLRFLLRSYLHASSLRDAVGVFANSELEKLPRLDPQLLTRPLRQYLRHGMSPRERVHAMRQHFRCLKEVLPVALIERLCSGASVALHDEDYEGTRLVFCVEGPGRWGREGELTLHMNYGACRAMTVAFSLAPGAQGHTMMVGALQGGIEADAALRQCSRSATRLRAHALMMCALQGLATGWGIDELRAVSTGAHIYSRSGSARRKVRIDYDDTWAQAGGESAGEHWLLPREPRLRCESEVPSKKRCQHRRRNATKLRIFETCANGARAMRAGAAASLHAQLA